MELFGITLLGVNAETGRRILMTVAILVIAVVIRATLGGATHAALKDHNPRAWFWSRQAVSVLVVVLGTLAMLSVWFDDTANLTSFIGLFTAGVAFALQKVITSIAGYLLILRGRNFELDVAGRHVGEVARDARQALARMRDRYYVSDTDFQPRVYMRLTDRYVELSLRFLTPDRDNREIKDRMGRELLDGLDQAGIHVGAAA
jgi:small-conductance mechanosensitive channel